MIDSSTTPPTTYKLKELQVSFGGASRSQAVQIDGLSTEWSDHAYLTACDKASRIYYKSILRILITRYEFRRRSI
eukprot:5560951-Pleurochrysis_carterae.AAC.3